jgi:hypothetical protein
MCIYRRAHTYISASYTVATVVQWIMTEFSEAVSEKDKIMVITKMLPNLMKLNG